MNIIFLLLIISNIYLAFTNSKVHSNNKYYSYNHILHRISLRCIIFKEKKFAKIMKQVKHNLDIYHNKSIVSLAEGIISYQELSEDEKTLIEAVISLCY